MTNLSIEKNVVYGMYSGLALLMDVYHPEGPNGYGIVLVNGSGWHAPMSYDATPLKELAATATYGTALVEAGYTVFAVNHRAAPRFRYPAAVEDVQRAVRYIRFHAESYGVRVDRIGASGGSSGGHLVSLLGVLDGAGDPQDADPVNRESARVQWVVARAAPSDFINTDVGGGDGAPTSFLGMPIRVGVSLYPVDSLEYRTYREASPLYHVTKAAPPFLLIHGDADLTVPFRNSELMKEALEQAGVEVKVLRIEGGGHGPGFPGAINPPDYLGEMVSWFNQHLAGRTAPLASTAAAPI